MSANNDNLAWTVPATATSTDHLTQRPLPIPTPGYRQVLVRLTAASLNYRDLLVATRSPEYPGNHVANLVPCSDGAGIIHSAGPESAFAGREGISVLLHPNEWLTGDVRNLNLQKVFGAAASEGTLCLYRYFAPDVLII